MRSYKCFQLYFGSSIVNAQKLIAGQGLGGVEGGVVEEEDEPCQHLGICVYRIVKYLLYNTNTDICSYI